MKSPLRIAIVDRSRLAHNVYQMLLKPLGYNLLSYFSLSDLRQHLNSKWGCRLFLINSNSFGKEIQKQAEWLKSSSLQSAAKVFLCAPTEKKLQVLLKKIPHSVLLAKPFSPHQLEEMLANLRSS